MHLIVNKEMLKKVEVKMTIDGHYRGLEGSHNKGNKYAKENSIKRMSQEEIDREMVELRVQLSYIGQLLHKI